MVIRTPPTRRRPVDRLTDAEIAVLLGIEETVTPGPIVSFRIWEIPLRIRRRALRVLLDRIAREERGIEAVEQAIRVTQAAMFPSDQVYRVSRIAWEKVIDDGK